MGRRPIAPPPNAGTVSRCNIAVKITVVRGPVAALAPVLQGPGPGLEAVPALVPGPKEDPCLVQDHAPRLKILRSPIKYLPQA
ncbi:unnamed protein product [Danaus chrysippus]|uniref:(African queen) hypothetical protein n=1 Tax=Danaus chrysippus TaxID=151541 RepID=A0A8J2RE63_9NEOP|nr:unnamed protein product [Danaus chrysippus]